MIHTGRASQKSNQCCVSGEENSGPAIGVNSPWSGRSCWKHRASRTLLHISWWRSLQKMYRNPSGTAMLAVDN
jgi:hypothetical protein